MSGQTNTMEIGMSTFLHANPGNGGVSHAQRRQAIEEIQLADQVGLDVYAIGEHHRIEYTSSSPAVILAARNEADPALERSDGAIFGRSCAGISGLCYVGRSVERASGDHGRTGIVH